MRRWGVLFLALAVVLSACGGQIEEAPPLVAPPTRTAVPATLTPSADNYLAYLSVSSLADEVRAYLDAAETASALERPVLFEQYVLTPRPECFDGDYLTPDAGATLMQRLHLTRVPQEFWADFLSGWREQVNDFPLEVLQEYIEQAFVRAAKILPPQGTLHVCLFPSPSQRFGGGVDMFVKHNGLEMYVLGRDLVFASCADGEVCLGDLPFVFAYAYHYAQQLHYTPRTVEDMSLLEFAIYNGRATDFALELYPEASFLWTAEISPQDEAEVWAAIQRYADVTPGETVEARQLDRVLYGKNTSHYPDWGGMIVGVHIVQAFRANNPDVSLAELAAMPATEVLARSGYAPPAP